ncbi:hypothetical protein J42TS3_21840 [Paenibacillus vini]|uniref:Uncharacterized protein n=1 Tax=Paenibacillus vini TaxID=1476024 RepID=A0ABQ4MAY1_9BACL|nr:hypothetical protein J42TS3_21840 [Paenibacillus vini]
MNNASNLLEYDLNCLCLTLYTEAAQNLNPFSIDYAILITIFCICQRLLQNYRNGVCEIYEIFYIGPA